MLVLDVLHYLNDEDIQKIHQKVNENRHFTLDDISEATGVSWSSCKPILTEDFQMRRFAAKFVPCFRLKVTHTPREQF